MRLLVLSLTAPFPATNGHRLRNQAILRALARDGHTITLAAFSQPGDEADLTALSELCRETILIPIQPARLSAGAGYLGRVRGLFSGVPYGVSRFRSAKMRERLGTLLAGGGFDAILSETSYPVVNLPASPLPLILDNHNAEHVLLERFAALSGYGFEGCYARLEAGKQRAWEHAAAAGAALVLTCSQGDRAELQPACAGRPVCVVPNVVDTAFYRNVTGGEQPSTVLFTGGMDWLPNRDAVEFFAFRVLPALRRLVPGVRFLVAGRGPSPEFRRRFQSLPEVEFTGMLADMRPSLSSAAVCVVPLRIGSGTRLKILEAAAMGKPVVSTRVGAEGLEFAEGGEIVLADRPDVFARAVGELLMDGKRRAALGARARRRVQQSYSFEVLCDSLRAALDLLSPCAHLQ